MPYIQPEYGTAVWQDEPGGGGMPQQPPEYGTTPTPQYDPRAALAQTMAQGGGGGGGGYQQPDMSAYFQAMQQQQPQQQPDMSAYYAAMGGGGGGGGAPDYAGMAAARMAAAGGGGGGGGGAPDWSSVFSPQAMDARGQQATASGGDWLSRLMQGQQDLYDQQMREGIDPAALAFYNTGYGGGYGGGYSGGGYEGAATVSGDGGRTAGVTGGSGPGYGGSAPGGYGTAGTYGRWLMGQGPPVQGWGDPRLDPGFDWSTYNPSTWAGNALYSGGPSTDAAFKGWTGYTPGMNYGGFGTAPQGGGWDGYWGGGPGGDPGYGGYSAADAGGFGTGGGGGSSGPGGGPGPGGGGGGPGGGPGPGQGPGNNSGVFGTGAAPVGQYADFTGLNSISGPMGGWGPSGGIGTATVGAPGSGTTFGQSAYGGGFGVGAEGVYGTNSGNFGGTDSWGSPGWGGP